MNIPMKTTVDIADPLLDEAQRIAARDGVTVRALIELGLRRVIAERQKSNGRFRLRRASFKGEGLHPDVQGAPWERIRALADCRTRGVESPSLTLLAESHLHWPQLRALLLASKTVGPQIHDGRIAALCLQHDVRALWSADRDFGRYPALKVVNPLVAPPV